MYLIPRNITKRFEFMPGFGWKELFITFIGLAIGVVLCLALMLFVNVGIRIILVVVFTAAGFMISQPVMPDGSSALDMFRFLLSFSKSKKLYIYQKRGL